MINDMDLNDENEIQKKQPELQRNEIPLVEKTSIIK